MTISNAMTASIAEIHRARTLFRWVGLYLPLVLLLGALVTVAIWLPRLPDPAAMHWGRNGADGFGPRWTALGPPLLGIAVVLLIGLLALSAHRLPGAGTAQNRGGVVTDREGVPRWSVTARFLGAMNLGLAGLLSFLAIVAAGVQLGLVDARQAPDIGPWMLLGAALAVVLVVAGWLLQPRVDSVADVATPAEPAPLGDDERVAWIGTATIGRAGAWVLGPLLLVTFALAVALAATGGPMAWVFLLVIVLVSVVAAVSSVFHVRVSSGGLSVRSLAGWPRIRIPADEIDAVGVVPVAPMADFGGWGWRIGLDGRMGVVLRAGDALQVRRRAGRTIVVTVDDADQAASVLAAVVARRRREGSGDSRTIEGDSE
ncbi:MULTISPECIES: DUF1648 domain-containing protein [Bacteria]|uniref:DUF1648 domain-containing protein n=1 Tax=Bacteria TaxID=2 RepID=UPI003C7A5407